MLAYEMISALFFAIERMSAPDRKPEEMLLSAKVLLESNDETYYIISMSKLTCMRKNGQFRI